MTRIIREPSCRTTDMATTRTKTHQLDTGYSWVVVFAATLVSFFQLGMVKVFGVFVPELVDQLEMSASAIGLSCSIGIGLRAILGPVWSALTRITSYRKLIITGGVLSSIGLICVSFSQSPLHLGCSMALLSIGSGVPSVAKVVVIKDYFEQKFSLANGIAFTGGAVGMTVLAPLMEYIIETYGWRGAMLLYGAMNLNICVGGALIVQPCRTTEKSSRTSETKNLQKNQMKFCCLSLSKRLANYLGLPVLSKHRVLILDFSAMAIHELVLSGWVLFLVSYTISSGYSAQKASFLSALGGGGALTGRLVVGPFIDKGLISGRMMFFWQAVGGALSMLCYPFCYSYWILALLSFVAGWCFGSSTPVFIVILKDVLQDDSTGFSGAVGLHYMMRGIGMLAGGPITGYLCDTSGNFYLSFITLAVLEAAAVTVILPRRPLIGKCRKQALTTTNVFQTSESIATNAEPS